MTVPLPVVEPVQQAAAYVAARARGDWAGAETLLAGFGSDAERLLAFCLLSELLIGLLADYDGAGVDEVAGRLATSIARAGIG